MHYLLFMLSDFFLVLVITLVYIMGLVGVALGVGVSVLLFGLMLRCFLACVRVLNDG